MDETSHLTRLIKPRRLGDQAADEFADRVVAAVTMLAGVDVEIPGPTPEKAGSPFVVSHGLGAIPQCVTMVDTGDYGGVCFAREEDKAEWTASHVVLRCTVKGETNMTVRLTRRPA